jgi:ABC-2 type transport system ATP-binding protein
MIEVRALTKRYGSTVAVDDLSFDVTPGRVTGFLGPNGAGKSTTMRIILGVDAPNAGSARIDGQAYASLPLPARKAGSVLEAKAVQAGRSAYNHLRWIAQAGGIDKRRVDEVLDLVGLESVAGKRAETFSLGMSQRLGIATALLGDPEILLFDEPVNGLDPEGIVWVRTLMKRLAAEGRTVFVSSHLMSEMQDTADHVIVIGRGKLIADMSMREFLQHSSSNHVRVVSPQAAELAALLAERGVVASEVADGGLVVAGMEAAQIGELAAKHAIVLHELSNQRASLEAAFIELTHDAVEYHAGGDEAASPSAAAKS